MLTLVNYVGDELRMTDSQVDFNGTSLLYHSNTRMSVFSFFFFFFKQKTAYEISACLVGSEMCIRDRTTGVSNLQLGA